MQLTGSRAARYKELVTSSPPTTYGLSLHLNIPRAMLSARGGRKNRV